MAANTQAAPAHKTSFRSRRSHQSLHNISLAPLTSTFPVEDYEEPNWDSRQRNSPESEYNYFSRPPRTYLSSTSVPNTPPLISQSRSVSNTPRSKTPTRVPLSDTNLESIASLKPLHHTGKSKAVSETKTDRPIRRQDSEWLLRAGLALAASTREEKGQAWLVKRESSTSLVSDPDQEDNGNQRRSRRSRVGGTPRSGLSTPMGLSRRGSRSHFSSRRGSRADLSMTIAEAVERHERNVSSLSETIGSIPDFVDENARAEMAYISQGMERGRGGNMIEFDDDSMNSRFETFSQLSSDSELDSEDEVDELEMQRLTRERGFGLGRWVDRLVEWTLFSVDEENQNYTPSASRTPPVSEAVSATQQNPEGGPVRGVESGSGVGSDDDESTIGDEPPSTLENPSPEGGWADVGWLLRVARKSVF